MHKENDRVVIKSDRVTKHVALNMFYLRRKYIDKRKQNTFSLHGQIIPANILTLFYQHSYHYVYYEKTQR
jgi:hypothetical protein